MTAASDDLMPTVAPLAGAWIEICKRPRICRIRRVAPLAGARIEITNDGVKKYLQADKKSSSKAIQAKANIAASGNYIDLMENAHYIGTATEKGENKNRFHNDAKYWDYYWKTVKVDGIMYDVLIDIKDTGENVYLYDVTLKEAGSLPSTPEGYNKTAAPASFVDIVSPNMGNLNLFSDRQEVYQYVNQTERLQKENKQLRDDIDRLRERLKLERKVTGGRVLNDYKLELIAKHLKNQFNSNYDTDSFKAGLKDLYNYILNGDEVDGQVVLDKSVDLSRSVLSQAKPQKVVNNYFKMIARDIRGTKISLSESQKAEAENTFGKDWRKYLFGRITVTNDGISLDTMWQEWSSRFPDLFDSSVNEAEQITAGVAPLAGVWIEIEKTILYNVLCDYIEGGHLIEQDGQAKRLGNGNAYGNPILEKRNDTGRIRDGKQIFE